MKIRVLPKILVLFLFLVFSFQVSAQSTTFSARVGDTTLLIKGFTSPNSLVVFKESGNVIGTTSSDSIGVFEKLFTAQDAGLKIIEIYSMDSQSYISSSLTENLFLIDFNQLEVNNIFLPPTMAVIPTSTASIDVDGYTLPNVSLRISFTGPSNFSDTITTNSNGYYKKNYDLTQLIPGIYSISTSILNLNNEFISATPKQVTASRVVSEDNPEIQQEVPINQSTNLVPIIQRAPPVFNFQALGRILGAENLNFLDENPQIISDKVLTSGLSIVIIVLIILSIVHTGIFIYFSRRSNHVKNSEFNRAIYKKP